MPETFSKSFYEVVANKTCAEFLHPGKLCREALKRTMFDAVMGSVKFYFPICAASLLFKNLKDSSVWKQFLIDFGKCFTFGFFLIASSFTTVCLSYNFFHRFFLPFLLTVPVTMSSLPCFILPPHILRVEGQGLFNMYLEFLIRRARSNLIVSLRNNKIAATAIFCFLHSVVMFGFLKNCPKPFWFTSFNIKPADEVNSNRCKRIHDKLTCREYFQKELKKTAKFAFGLCVVKVLPKCKILPLLKTPWEIPMRMLKKFDYGLMMLFVSINALFKFSFCTLNRSTSQSTELNCIFSALLSGVGYWFYPRYIVFTMAITNAIESLFNLLKKNSEKKYFNLTKVVEFIDRVPIVYLMFVVCAGLNLQLRILYPSIVNKYTFKILSLLSNGKGDWIAKNLIDILFGLK